MLARDFDGKTTTYTQGDKYIKFPGDVDIRVACGKCRYPYHPNDLEDFRDPLCADCSTKWYKYGEYYDIVKSHITNLLKTSKGDYLCPYCKKIITPSDFSKCKTLYGQTVDGYANYHIRLSCDLSKSALRAYMIKDFDRTIATDKMLTEIDEMAIKYNL